jgi:hypothetical protein
VTSIEIKAKPRPGPPGALGPQPIASSRASQTDRSHLPYGRGSPSEWLRIHNESFQITVTQKREVETMTLGQGKHLMTSMLLGNRVVTLR